MSAHSYLQHSTNRPQGNSRSASAYDTPDDRDPVGAHSTPNGAGSPTNPPPAFLAGFRRRTEKPEELEKQKASIAQVAGVAATARRFVTNFIAKRDSAKSPEGELEDVSENEDGPHPSRFNPKAVVGAKGFVGAVASHLQESEARKAKLRAHRAHQLAVKGVYNKKAATTPTTSPAGAPRFFHTLPTTLPSTYFNELSLKADEAQLPNGGGLNGTLNATTTTRDFASYWECDEVSRDLLTALKIAHGKGLYGKASFVANERVQSLKDVPLKELVHGDSYWKMWRAAVDSFVTTHATTALNGRYMLGSNKGRFIVIGNSSVLDALEGVLVHVWRSNIAAKEFIHGWRRTWQAVFESRLDGITCPFSVAYRIQGSYVSVTALCPLEPSFNRYVTGLSPSTIWGAHGVTNPSNPLSLPDIAPDAEPPITVTAEAVRLSVRRFCHAMCIDAPPPLMLGLDGRYYITDVRYVLQPSFNDSAIRSRPRLELLMQMRDLRGLVDAATGVVSGIPPALDRYAEEETGIRALMTSAVLTSPLNFVRRVGARRCAIDVLRALVDMETDTPLTVEAILDKNLVSVLCHRYGLNLCFLPLLVEAALGADIPVALIAEHQRSHLGALLAEAARVEMLSRTLKELAAMDLNFGVTASTPVNDIARRIHVPNRIASFAVAKDPLFFQDQVMPRLRTKFYGATPELYVDPASTTAGRLLRNLIFHLGCELCSEQKRFTHYCPISGTYAMVLRPPKTTELYISKQYTELEAEVPQMWRRWNITPTTSPVRHSAFIHSAFLTLLCREREQNHFVKEAADECAADFDDCAYLQAEIYSIASEAALITGRDAAPLRVYIAQLKQLPRAGTEDSPIFAVKFLNAGLLGSRCNLFVTAANALIRLEHATPSIHSATYNFAVSAAEALLVNDENRDTLDEYLNVRREHAVQVRPLGLGQAVQVMMHTNAVLLAASEKSAAYGSAGAVEYARASLRAQMEGLGPRNRCSCVTTYQVMIFALRERMSTGVPAVARHLKLAQRVHDLILQAEVKAIPAMTRSDRSMDLMERVINVLRDSGDRSTAGLLRQQRDSIQRGELVDPAVELELSMSRAHPRHTHGPELTPPPSRGLARTQPLGSFAGAPRSANASFAGAPASIAGSAKMDMEEVESDHNLSQSLHSPKAEEPEKYAKVVRASGSSFRLRRPDAGLDVNDIDAPAFADLVMEPSALRLSQVNFSVTHTDVLEDLE
jgi:hypothetical protein